LSSRGRQRDMAWRNNAVIVRRRVGAHSQSRRDTGGAPVANDRDRATAPSIPARRPLAERSSIFLHARARNERTHDADGCMDRMENRTRAHDRLVRRNNFPLEEIAIAKHSLQWRHVGVCAQHEDSVEPRLFGGLPASISNARSPCLCPCFRLVLGPGALAQITPVGGVVDQRLVAFSIGVERGDDRSRSLRLFAPPRCGRRCSACPRHDLLTKTASRPPCAPTAEDEGASFSSTILRTMRRERSRAPRIYSSLRAFQPSIVAAEIMPRSATTQTADGEAAAQPINHRQQRVTSRVLAGTLGADGRPFHRRSAPRSCFRSGR